MASKNLFGSAQKSMPATVRQADTKNEAGGVAYSYTPEHGLAQYAVTGTFSNTFYASDEDQMKKVTEFASKCDPVFVAKTAVYARERGYMKDMPAFLLTYLAAKDMDLTKKVFPRVVDSPKMVRNFVQMLRSGQLGRKSLGTAPKRLVTNYLNGLSDDALFRADVGSNGATLQDIIKMVHPSPKTKGRAALYGYLLDKKTGKFGNEEFPIAENLTETIKAYEDFKRAIAAAGSESEKNKLVPPDVPFLMLTALPLTKEHWKTIARRASWHQVRMNLNTFARHGVFEDSGLVKQLAAKLADADQIRRARVFPYQLFAAHSYLGDEVPASLRNAVQDAADIALDNVPKIDGFVAVCTDVSGSMKSPATGVRKGATSKVDCIHVAALVAAVVLRQNPDALILPFEETVVDVSRLKLNSRDSIMTNAQKLASIGGGGTNCSAPLQLMNAKGIKPDLTWFVSDNQSWVDAPVGYYGGRQATSTMGEFAKLKARHEKAKMVRLDIQAYSTTQVNAHPDVMNVGGFSDSVFEIVSAFAKGDANAKTLVDTIKAIDLDGAPVS